MTEDNPNIVIPVTGRELRLSATTGEYVCGYVGVGSRHKEMSTPTPQDLGFCYKPSRRHGIIWDVAFGYVSGIPASAILWYLLTRTLPPRSIVKRIQDWERRTGRYDGRVIDVTMGDPVDAHNIDSRRTR